MAISAYPNAIHYLSGMQVTVTQSDSSTVTGRLSWSPGRDTATVTRSDGKSATFPVTQLSWVDGTGRDWPAHGKVHPGFSGTPQVPA